MTGILPRRQRLKDHSKQKNSIYKIYEDVISTAHTLITTSSGGYVNESYWGYHSTIHTKKCTL